MILAGNKLILNPCPAEACNSLYRNQCRSRICSVFQADAESTVLTEIMQLKTVMQGFTSSWMFGGPWDSTLNMMGVPSLKLGVPSFYISFEFWKVVHPSVKAQCNCVVPRSVILRAMFGPLPIFLGGAIWNFWGPHITISETQSYTLFLQKLNLSLKYAGPS